MTWRDAAELALGAAFGLSCWVARALYPWLAGWLLQRRMEKRRRREASRILNAIVDEAKRNGKVPTGKPAFGFKMSDANDERWWGDQE